MMLSDALLVVRDGMGLQDTVGTAVGEMINMLQSSCPGTLELDIPDFPSFVEDIDMVLFDLAEAVSDAGGPAFSTVSSLLRGLAHLRMSQDGSEGTTMWVHEGFNFGSTWLNVPMSPVRCPNCGHEDEYADFVLHWLPMGETATCPSCHREISVMVVSVTLHVSEDFT